MHPPTGREAFGERVLVRYAAFPGTTLAGAVFKGSRVGLPALLVLLLYALA